MFDALSYHCPRQSSILTPILPRCSSISCRLVFSSVPTFLMNERKRSTRYLSSMYRTTKVSWSTLLLSGVESTVKEKYFAFLIWETISLMTWVPSRWISSSHVVEERLLVWPRPLLACCWICAAKNVSYSAKSSIIPRTLPLWGEPTVSLDPRKAFPRSTRNLITLTHLLSTSSQ